MRPPNRDVFINCPFDEEYQPLFRAICFTVVSCGFNPRSALETPGSGEARLDRICRLIGQCDLGIHDVSRTELSSTGYPRFNMPFELGLFLGCKRWGGVMHRGKRVLVLDREPHRHRLFLSDLAGHDPEPHSGNVCGVIAAVRNWLQSVAGVPFRGPVYIEQDFRWLLQDLPVACVEMGLDAERISFEDLVNVVHQWLREYAAQNV